MPKFLLEVSYTAEGAKGLLKDGGTKRQSAARAMIESLGGKMEAFYFAFGDTDAVVIAELPDNVSAAAASVTLGSSGAVSSRSTVLLTPEELDKAVKRTPAYSPPGR